MRLLLNSWLESLKYFLPQNFGPFFLVSLKAVKEMCNDLWQNKSILMILIILFIFNYYFRSNSNILFFKFVLLFELIIPCLLLRPSIKCKNFYYIISKINLPLFILLAIFSFVLPAAIIFPLFFLFFMDTQQYFLDIFKSVWRGLKLLIYNLPFCLILIFIQGLFGIPLEIINQQFGENVITYFLVIIIVTMYLAMLTNFYIKRIHDQFSIYYKVKS